ncbi:conserved Plasmodium membrane protein, unknown function [Plasmodium gaboni]|uniref:Serpentine receptor n=1 Tax=Plasmodium gaboni TaxID=647221 RepID=A0ABY1UN60_9APIC|nr:conserved Plasmodium membrane protein, unknown function [Plasmodium gaboni]
MDRNNNIVNIEKKRKEKIKEEEKEKEKKNTFDSSHIKNIFLLGVHLLFYIILVNIYYTYNNDNSLQCFNHSFSYILKSPYLNIYDVENIQNNLSNISQMCNHDKLNYSKYIDTDYFKYSFLFYNQHVNTYIDYVIIFYKLNQSEILKKVIHISTTKYFFWTEWVFYIFFNLMTCAIIYIYWTKKERKENIFHVSIISLININIIYQQFIGFIEYGSTYETFIALLIYIYYILLILNIFKEFSKFNKIFLIPINIIRNTLKHSKVLFISLCVFIIVPFVQYITSSKNYSDYIKSFDLFEKKNIYKNEYPYYFLFSLIYNFFFIPIIIVISTASTFLLVNKNDLLLSYKLSDMPFWLKIKEYLFFFQEKEKQVNKNLSKPKMFISDEKNVKNMSILKLSNICCLGLFFIFLILKINFDQSSYDHINKKYNLLLKEYFLADTNVEKSYDTFTSSTDYYNFLNSIVIKNIMRNKKDLQNKNLLDINLNLNDYNNSIYDDFFNHFPYDLFIKFSDDNQISDEIAIGNPLLAHESTIDNTQLENYKSIIDDNKGRIKYYDAYSILYNFEYSISLLIRTSFKVQNYGVFKKDKEIFVHEIYEDNYNNMYNYKNILLILIFIITIIYLILTICMVYYIRSKIYISFFSFFFLTCFFFFLFHFMSFKPVSYFYDYIINDIKANQVSEIFNDMNKQDHFRSLLFDLLKIKWYTFYANLFSYIIILTALLNFFFFFFIKHISILIKYKNHFLFVSIPIWISVFFMSLIGSYFPCNIQKNILKWILLFYQIQTNQKSFPYEVLNKFIFVFFLFYLTSIFLFIYVKKKPNIIKLKKRNYQNDQDTQQLPFNHTNIDEHYDIILYFKAVLYSLDKTFEKVQLLKEKKKFSQMINLQINMYNMYEKQKMMLQCGNLNGQNNHMMRGQDNCFINGQVNYPMDIQGNNYKNKQIHNYVNKQIHNYENGQTNNYVNKQIHNYMNGQENNYVNSQTNNYINKQIHNYMNDQENNYVNSQTNNYINKQIHNYMNGQENNYVNSQTNNYVNGQTNNYVNSQTNNYMNGQENNYVNGQTNNYMNGQENNYVNGQVPTDNPYRPNENIQTSSQIMNGKNNYNYHNTMDVHIQEEEGINTNIRDKCHEIKKKNDQNFMQDGTSNNEDLERQNENKDIELDMIEKIENMNLFFTNILNEKYDFNFLKDENIKNKEKKKKKTRGKKKTLVEWMISGLYDKDNYRRNEEDKEKKQKNTKQLKRMIENLNEDLYYIDKIKISFTYLLFLKIKKYILIQNFNNLKEKKGELKRTYQNKILYKNHLSKIQKNITKKMNQLEKNVLITNNLKDGLIYIIEDEAFYKKDEENSNAKKKGKKKNIENEEQESNKGGIFGKSII